MEPSYEELFKQNKKLKETIGKIHSDLNNDELGLSRILTRINTVCLEILSPKLTPQEEEISRLKKVIEPFAQFGKISGVEDLEEKDDDDWFRHDGAVIKVGDFRKAIKACENF